jgi:Ras-related protein Rab-2A
MSQSWDYIAKIVSIGDSGTGKSSLTVRLCEGRFVSHHDVTIGVEFGSRIVPVGPPASLELNINNPVSPSTSTDSAVTKDTTKATTAATTPSKRKSTDAPPAAQMAVAKQQKHMKLSLWDTAGQETYKSITRSYFRGASGALLVFDIARRSTFDSATAWLNDLRQIAEDGIVVVLVGNKSDLDSSSSSARDEHPFANGTGAGGAGTGKKRKREVSRAEAEEWARTHNVLAYVETSAKSGEGVERAFREVAERIWQGIEAGRYNLDDRRSGVRRAGAQAGGNVRMNVGLDDARSRGGGGGCC